MATNEQNRRAIGSGNASQRQATGTSNAAERRAIQTNNTNERRGSSIQSDLNSLIYPEKQSTTLRTVEPRGTLPAARGSGTYKAPAAGASTGGAGYTSPLIETSYDAREYWPEQTLASSDGLLTFKLKAIKKVVSVDSNPGAPQQLVQQYAEPTIP